MSMHQDELHKIKISTTKNKLTMAAGLGALIELFDQSPLKKEFMSCLPERTSHRSVGSYQMALTLMVRVSTLFDGTFANYLMGSSEG